MKLSEKISEIKQAVLEAKYPGNHWPLRGGLTQRDNKIRPSGTCNFTAAANCLDYLQIPIDENVRKKFSEYTQTEDILSAFSETKESHVWFKNIYPQFNAKESDVRPRHFSEMVAWVVNRCTGFFVANWEIRTFDEIVAAVEAKKPVVVSGKFTASGHFIALKGIAPDKTFFWVDDSWGDYYSSYKKTNGHNLRYMTAHVRGLCWQNQKRHRTIIFEVQNEKSK